jgi:endonuclease/exonuclease/phosphatase (EEP) superfamily protein YafD
VSVPVLSWNINGSRVDAPTVVHEVSIHHPSVVVLPSISDAVLAPIAQESSSRGYTLIHPADSETAIFASADYAPAPESAYGPGRTREAIAYSASRQPEIIAVHLRIPLLPGGNADWNQEIDWMRQFCRAKTPAIIIGDFNATTDNFQGTGTQRCTDAATVTGVQRVGTWPTALPPLVGIAIDHLLVSGTEMKVTHFDVLRDQDNSGALHRPILVTLTSPKAQN